MPSLAMLHRARRSLRRPRRWAAAAAALATGVVLVAAQQLYFELRDLRVRSGSNADTALSIALLARRDPPQAAAERFQQSLAHLQGVEWSQYCDPAGCLTYRAVPSAATCAEATGWRSVCAHAARADGAGGLSLRRSLLPAYADTARDTACFALILGIAAWTWSATARRLRLRMKDAQDALQRAATHDSVTGLLNRAAFEHQASERMLVCGREAGALLYMDLDGFKHVNDSYGHHTGDKVLEAIAQRIRQAMDGEDVIGRLGGDEFGVLLAGAHSPAEVNHRAALLVKAVSAPMAVQGKAVAVGLSVGAVVLDDAVGSFDEALRRADVALYEAKRSGRARVCHYAPAMDEVMRTRYQLQMEIETALDRQQFFLEYQPQVGGDEVLRGVEALVRWRHPSRGLVRPDHFIAAAEESGSIVRLGMAVLDMACGDLVHARSQGLHLPYVSVNVSPRQLQDAAFVTDVLRALKRHRLGPRDVELEITESTLMEAQGSEEAVIENLAALGFRIAIDDFGTGYSSLARLQSMRVDKLKIDRTFIKQLPGATSDRAIPEAILGLAEKLNLKTVAEGVETAEQAAWLQHAGCMLMQGYFYARPMPIEALVEWIEARQVLPEQREGWAETAPLVVA